MPVRSPGGSLMRRGARDSGCSPGRRRNVPYRETKALPWAPLPGCCAAAEPPPEATARAVVEPTTPAASVPRPVDNFLPSRSALLIFWITDEARQVRVIRRLAPAVHDG